MGHTGHTVVYLHVLIVMGLVAGFVGVVVDSLRNISLRKLSYGAVSNQAKLDD